MELPLRNCYSNIVWTFSCPRRFLSFIQTRPFWPMFKLLYEPSEMQKGRSVAAAQRQEVTRQLILFKIIIQKESLYFHIYFC